MRLLILLLLGLQAPLRSVSGCFLSSCWASVRTQSDASESPPPTPPPRGTIIGRQTSRSVGFAGYPLEYIRMAVSTTWSGLGYPPQAQQRLLTNSWEDTMYNLPPKKYFDKIKYVIQKEYDKLTSDRPFHPMGPEDLGCNIGDHHHQKECDTQMAIYLEGVEYAKRAGYKITRAILVGDQDTLDFSRHESPTVLSDYYYYIVICGSNSKNKMSLRINAFYDARDNPDEKDYRDFGSIRCDESPKQFLYATTRPKLGISSLKLKRSGWNSKAPVFVTVAHVPMRPRISRLTQPMFSNTDVTGQSESRTDAEQKAVKAILRFSSHVMTPAQIGLFARPAVSVAKFATPPQQHEDAYDPNLITPLQSMSDQGLMTNGFLRAIGGITNGKTFFYDAPTIRMEASGAHTTSIFRIQSGNAVQRLRVYWTCQASVPDVESRMMMVIGFDTIGRMSDGGELQHGTSVYLQVEDPRSGWTTCDAVGSSTPATVHFAEWRIGTSSSSIAEFFHLAHRNVENSFAEEFKARFWNNYWIGFQAVASKGPAAFLRIAVQLNESPSAPVNRRQDSEGERGSTGFLLKDIEDTFDMDTVPVLQNGRIIDDGEDYQFRPREWELANSIADFYDTHVLLYDRNVQKRKLMEQYDIPGIYHASWRGRGPIFTLPLSVGDGTVDVYGNPVVADEDGSGSARSDQHPGSEAMNSPLEQGTPRTEMEYGTPRSNTEQWSPKSMPPLEPLTPRSEASAEDSHDQRHGDDLDNGHEHKHELGNGRGQPMETTMERSNGQSPKSNIRPVPILQLPEFKNRQRGETSADQRGNAVDEDTSVKDVISDSTGSKLSPLAKAKASIQGRIRRWSSLSPKSNKDTDGAGLNDNDGPPGLLSPRRGWRESWSNAWGSPRDPTHGKNSKDKVWTAGQDLKGTSPNVRSSTPERPKSWSIPWSALNPIHTKDSNDQGGTKLDLEGKGPPSVRSPLHERTRSWAVADELSPHSSD